MPYLVNKSSILLYMDKLVHWILTCLLQQKFLHLLNLKIHFRIFKTYFRKTAER